MTPTLVRIAKPALKGQHLDLWGDCSGLRGDCSGLRGDLGTCGLTDEDRATGVDISTLIAP